MGCAVPDHNRGKETDYELLCRQIESLAEESREIVPVLANASALLYEALSDLNWAGFYLVRNGELLLGPFQGKAACVRIARGRGVCGTAWERDEAQIVPDVHAFPGHIACDGASRSEIVIPLHAGEAVAGVMDLDSPSLARFTEADGEGLSAFARTLERIIDWRCRA